MDANRKTLVPGILLFHHDDYLPYAATVRENLDSFSRYSRFPVHLVNLHFGLPPSLTQYQFSAMVFHYSLPPMDYYWLTPEFVSYVTACRGTYKVAIFQDEIWHFQERFSFLTQCQIDCLYSRHKPNNVRGVYSNHTPVKEFVYYLAGYVADDLIERGKAHQRAYEQRSIDVGYRGRQLPFYMGRGGQEKAEIGRRFAQLTADRGLKIDIALEEHDRLYGESWDRFLGSCKAVLSVEGGVSVIDRDGRFVKRSREILKEDPHLDFEEFSRRMGSDFTEQEDKIYYRCITPRHFEAAAFRCLQINFEGQYDGLMTPGVHYVPLRKDFSNLDEVLQILKNRERAGAIIEQANRDLIASGRFTYAQFIQSFDEHLIAAGVQPPAVATGLVGRMQEHLQRWTELNQRATGFRRIIAQKLDEGGRGPSRVAAVYRRAMRAWYRWRIERLERMIQRSLS